MIAGGQEADEMHSRSEHIKGQEARLKNHTSHG